MCIFEESRGKRRSNFGNAGECLFKSSCITVMQGKVGFSVCAGNLRPHAKLQRLMETCQPGNCVTSFRRPIVLKRDRSSSC